MAKKLLFTNDLDYNPDNIVIPSFQEANEKLKEIEQFLDEVENREDELIEELADIQRAKESKEVPEGATSLQDISKMTELQFTNRTQEVVETELARVSAFKRNKSAEMLLDASELCRKTGSEIKQFIEPYRYYVSPVTKEPTDKLKHKVGTYDSVSSIYDRLRKQAGFNKANSVSSEGVHVPNLPGVIIRW